MGLTYAGVLPVWIGMGALQFADIPWIGSGMLAYGAIIVSFICGMHWATFMSAAGPLSTCWSPATLEHCRRGGSC